MKHITLVVSGITFCDHDIPDDWAFSIATTPDGGVELKTGPAKANPLGGLLNNLGQASAASSRRQTAQKRDELAAKPLEVVTDDATDATA